MLWGSSHSPCSPVLIPSKQDCDLNELPKSLWAAQLSGFLTGFKYFEKQIPLSLSGLGSWSPLACDEVRALALGEALLGLLFPQLYSKLLLSLGFHPCCVSKDKGNKRT